ncbi:hypothetical protein [Companilactobacillus nantensis]|uniref:hypothetical protein n=1 Tax=Companilactobacillus nantensis TaxID=305793 RepID=UPI00070B74A8|nr:hypothetical protein [Companilactobacillus nantensis]GEO65469.1 hypothetical protein LNA01_26520 [Companilactobacillus nantensis]
MKKNIMISLIVVSLVSPITTTIAQADTADASNSENINKSNQIKIQPRSAIIEWRFKNINGHAYKRQFNYSADKWVGDWIRI